MDIVSYVKGIRFPGRSLAKHFRTLFGLEAEALDPIVLNVRLKQCNPDTRHKILNKLSVKGNFLHD